MLSELRIALFHSGVCFLKWLQPCPSKFPNAALQSPVLRRSFPISREPMIPHAAMRKVVELGVEMFQILTYVAFSKVRRRSKLVEFCSGRLMATQVRQV